MFPKSIFCFYLPGRFSYPLSVHAWFVTSTDLHDIIDNKSWRFVGWTTTDSLINCHSVELVIGCCTTHCSVMYSYLILNSTTCMRHKSIVLRKFNRFTAYFWLYCFYRGTKSHDISAEWRPSAKMP